MAEVDAGAFAPVPVAPAADAAPTVDPTAGTSSEAPQGDTPAAEKMLPQSEVDRIVSKTRAQEQRRLEKRIRDQVRAEVERDMLKQQLETRSAPQPQGKPSPQDFKDYESYVEALSDWKVDEKLKTRAQEHERETREQAQARMVRDRADAANSSIAKAREKYDDFDDVALSEDVPIAEPMAAYIAEHPEIGGELAYYLGTHREEAARIYKLSPVKQIVEMQSLQAKLKATPTPTRTPAPITPNKTSASVEKDPSDMSYDEFVKWRRRSIAQRR
jgi:hypothetical protein